HAGWTRLDQGAGSLGRTADLGGRTRRLLGRLRGLRRSHAAGNGGTNVLKVLAGSLVGLPVDFEFPIRVLGASVATIGVSYLMVRNRILWLEFHRGFEGRDRLGCLPCRDERLTKSDECVHEGRIELGGAGEV